MAHKAESVCTRMRNELFENDLNPDPGVLRLRREFFAEIDATVKLVYTDNKGNLFYNVKDLNEEDICDTLSKTKIGP